MHRSLLAVLSVTVTVGGAAAQDPVKKELTTASAVARLDDLAKWLDFREAARRGKALD